MPDDVLYEKLRNLHISFDPDDVIDITGLNIPLYVKFVASLGIKFGFPVLGNDCNYFNDLIDGLEKILNECNEYSQLECLKKDFELLYKESVDDDCSSSYTYAQLFIKQIAQYVKVFVKKNADVIISPVDKGGKVIIMTKELYVKKVYEHISAGLIDHTYFHCKSMNEDDCRELLEPMYDKLRLVINPFLAKDVFDGKQCTCRQLISEPYIISRLYVLMKIHKEGLPPRPIISSVDCWGKEFSSWLLRKLQLVSSLFSSVKVKNSEEFVTKYGNKPLKNLNHRLATWDYSSMFTNTPLHSAIKVVRENYMVVASETCVPVDLFIEAISFFIVHCSYFNFNGEVYRQCKNLSMGNRLSQVLAEISTGYATVQTLKSLRDEEISFVVKYVDDFIGAMDPGIMTAFENKIMSFINGLTIKRTDESSDRSVSFLDLLVVRDEVSFENINFIKMQWWQKPCSSKKIVNFHSLHPTSLKSNVVYEYTRHALCITSPCFYQLTMKNLKHTFTRSSYPPNFIKKILNKVLTSIGSVYLMSSVGEPDDNFNFLNELNARSFNNALNEPLLEIKGCKIKESNVFSDAVKHIPIPFKSHNTINRVKGLVKKHYVRCRLAPRVIRSNRMVAFSRLKDNIPLSSIKFATFGLECKNCSFVKFFRTRNLDVFRTVKHVINLEDSPLRTHVKENFGHVFSFNPIKLVKYRNETDLQIAFNRINVWFCLFLKTFFIRIML